MDSCRAWRVGRLDMLRRKVIISEALTDVKGHVQFGPPKTKAARRTITMPQTLVDELAAHLATYEATEDGLVFTASDGGPIRVTNWRRRIWYPAVDASVGRPMRPHDLRHTHAALLITQGAHPKVIQTRLGHSSIRTTLDTYGHLFPGLDEDAADALDEAAADARVGFSWG